MALGQLTVRLGLDAADFVQGMSRSEVEAQRLSSKIASDLASAATTATIALGSLASAGVAAFSFVNQQADNIAVFQQLSEKMGDTAEALASIKKASDVSGTSLDSIAAASIKLTAALSKTDEEGQGAAKAIKALGLDFNDFKALAPVDQIDAVAKAMNGFEDGANKTAVAVALWGKSGADMIPLLNDLANGSERQTTLTQDQIKAADDFSKSIARLVSDFDTWKSQLAAEVIPAAAEVLTQLLELKKYALSGGESVNLLGIAFGGLKTVFETAVVLATDVAYVFKGVGREIGGVAAQIVELARLDFKGFSVIGQAVKEDAAKARKDLDEFQKKFLLGNTPAASTFKPSDNYGSGKKKPTLNYSGIKTTKDKSNSGSEKQSEADKYLANLQRQLEATDKLSVSAALLRDIDLGRLGVLLPAQQEELLFIAQKIDAVKANELAEKTAADAKKQAWDLEKKSILEVFKSYDEVAQKKLEVGEALRQSVMTDMEKIIAQELLYNKYLADGTITLETYGRLMDQLQDKVVALDNPFQTLKDIGTTATQSLVDGMANAIQSSKKLEDVFRGVIKQLGTMILKALIFKAIEIGLNAVVPGLGTAIAGKRAAGGPVGSGKTYLVGEKGPELFTPGASGKITSNAETFRSQGGSAGGMTNVYNISAPGVSREEFTAGLNRSQAGAVSDVRDNKLRRRA